MYYVYVLENQNDKSFYIGFTANLKKRLFEHQNSKGGRTTSLKLKSVPRGEAFRGWKLIYFESYLNKLDAIGREKFLKSGSGRRYLYIQMAHYLNPLPIPGPLYFH